MEWNGMIKKNCEEFHVYMCSMFDMHLYVYVDWFLTTMNRDTNTCKYEPVFLFVIVKELFT